ncbi:branched-chain amino acid aminotransferase [Aerococcaceae bacterium DSM 109653]|uniref:Branched-chain-amino-acid aminotransferase n=1 Tax=Fundicoccus ignavus TaxID=2664442 RepID=A0A844BKQ9_9LACT|nr:branched-chain amino acid aminotransferase [Fundicoccus ignavus]MRI82500.1 branched-chain amino acid aminotransferase [Fundicoccus ignavus]
MTAITPDTIQWNDLGFSYIDTGKSFRAYFKDGQWSEGQIESSKYISISEASPVFHYGQSCFEGLKAYRTQNGDIQLFRPDKNADRMIDSAERLLMEPYPKEAFIEAVHKIVKENAEWVPPYESGATLYIRPFLMGVGDIVGVKPADEYIFSIFVTPVGPYFKGGLKPANFLISDYDRAAPNGTGAAKVGGNYAAGNLAGKLAKDQGYADAIFLDPATKTKIEEVGSANFFAITADNRFITPKSPSILPSITKYSLIDIARERLGMEAVETDVYLEELSGFSEAGAMGTAAVITPIGSIVHGEHRYVFGNGQEVGSVTQRLYSELVGIQFGDVVAPEGWIQKVKLG